MFLEHKYTIDDLVKRCKAGERKAQELLYKQFAAKMLGVCIRYATDKMEAEDMLQNGFVIMFQKINDYRGEGSFEGWVRRIMVHAAIGYYRKHHKMMQMVELDDATGDTAVNPLATTNLAAKDLLQLIQRLPPGYRIVFNLFAIEGYSHKEIAMIAGITEGASKSQLSRARSVLKKQIIKMEEKDMDMQDNEFEKLFGSKLGDLEVEPSARVWNGIDHQLTANRRRKVWVPVLSIAAAIIVLVTVGVLFIPQKMKVNTGSTLVKTGQPTNRGLIANSLKAGTLKPTQANRFAKAATITNIAITHNAVPLGVIFSNPIAAQSQPQESFKNSDQSEIATRQTLAIVNPVEATQLNINEPVVEAIFIEDKTIAVVDDLPAADKQDAGASNTKPKIRRLGDVINFVVSKVDKRPDKIIEFNNNEDEGAKITAVNLGFVKIKKDQ